MQVAGENIVKAQIKLRFRNVMGKPVIAVRSFMLTQKASKREYKTMDATLSSRNEHGEVRRPASSLPIVIQQAYDDQRLKPEEAQSMRCHVDACVRKVD